MMKTHRLAVRKKVASSVAIAAVMIAICVAHPAAGQRVDVCVRPFPPSRILYGCVCFLAHPYGGHICDEVDSGCTEQRLCGSDRAER